MLHALANANFSSYGDDENVEKNQCRGLRKRRQITKWSANMFLTNDKSKMCEENANYYFWEGHQGLKITWTLECYY